MSALWEYRASTEEDGTALNEHLNKMADVGWELVSGSSVSYVTQEWRDNYNGPVLHFRYTMFWRRPAKNST
jgi:hypothetical protein